MLLHLRLLQLVLAPLYQILPLALDVLCPPVPGDELDPALTGLVNVVVAEGRVVLRGHEEALIHFIRGGQDCVLDQLLKSEGKM